MEIYWIQYFPSYHLRFETNIPGTDPDQDKALTEDEYRNIIKTFIKAVLRQQHFFRCKKGKQIS